ncbi:MAG TPA: hypothetical protein VFN13_08135 [Rudaea sp.]|nr:hypothetical protein [Rudaea sp.]
MRDYELDLDDWFVEVGETYMTWGYRRDLHDSLAVLDPAQRRRLAQADAKASVLFGKHKDASDPCGDIAQLRSIIGIIEAERSAQAA